MRIMATLGTMRATHEVAVVGGGPAGLLAALLIGRTGASVALIAPPLRPDARTTALLDGSVSALRAAGVWDAVAPEAAPLRTLRIVDTGRRLFRAPEATFHARELGLEAFGWNTPNGALTAALGEAVAALPNVETIDGEARAALPEEDAVEIEVSGREPLRARLAVAADGRTSLLREAAGIAFKARSAPQTALAFAAAHERDHDFVSTELHGDEGPFTLVPMPGRRSSVVWACAPERADRLRALPLEALSEEATRESGRLLGRLAVEGRVGSFPITIGAATRLAGRRTVLVGEAGHVLPPIGAQGLNLGVRDAIEAARIVELARAEGRDPGGDPALRAYARARSADVYTRTAATDLLNRSLLTAFAPLHAVRGLGLGVLSRIGPLRRFVMREGLVGGRSF